MKIHLSAPSSHAASSAAMLTLTFTAYTLLCSLAAKAQNAPASPSSQPHQQHDANQDSPANSGTTLRLKVNVVAVPIVVRDSAGHAVGNLQKENFQLFDDRKQQQITQFTGGYPDNDRATNETWIYHA